MRNAGLDEAQAGIKISGRNINNLRYAPSPGDLPDPGTESASLMSPALAGRFFTMSTTC